MRFEKMTIAVMRFEFSTFITECVVKTAILWLCYLITQRSYPYCDL